VIYPYGFVDSGTEAPPGTLEGIDGNPVFLLELDDISAAVSRVSDDRYGKEAVERHSQDLDWVAEQGISHERVVTWFVDRGEIVPVRLLTLYTSEEHLVEDATKQRDRVLRELDRLDGRREWDLKVTCDAERLEECLGRFSDEVAELDRRIEEANPGKRYLLERKREDAVRSVRKETARRLAGELLDELAELAADTVTVPLPREAEGLPVVLSAALLVERESEDRLRERLARETEELEEAGIRAELTGPWAPYRFVEDADGA
jgi:hypothetical protein